MEILMAISSDQNKNQKARASLSLLKDVEVKTLPTLKELENYVVLPFIQIVGGEKRIGVDDIDDFVEEELAKSNGNGKK